MISNKNETKFRVVVDVVVNTTRDMKDCFMRRTKWYLLAKHKFKETRRGIAAIGEVHGEDVMRRTKSRHSKAKATFLRYLASRFWKQTRKKAERDENESHATSVCFFCFLQPSPNLLGVVDEMNS